jgi:hypothetical protein
LVACDAPTKFREACWAVAPTKPLPPFCVVLFWPRPTFCDCCNGLLFDPNAFRPDEFVPMPLPPEELPVPVVRLPPNMPELDEPLPPPMPPPIPPPELPNCAQTGAALTVMPNTNSQERFNARRMANSFGLVAVND